MFSSTINTFITKTSKQKPSKEGLIFVRGKHRLLNWTYIQERGCRQWAEFVDVTVWSPGAQ